MRERGCVVWMTGLPSGGKTTLATMLEAALLAQGRRVERLDGDDLRTHLTKDLGFSREDRDENVRRVGWVARLLARHGVIAITALVSPYRGARDEVRAGTADFIEVWVKASLDECIRRDVKGLYKKALAGDIPHFTGVSDPYEPPLQAEVVVETDRETKTDAVAKILSAMAERGYVAADAVAVAHGKERRHG
ncbi:MAG TPA: adenylyl-sulfate kinase [Vicinamibacterales bacterium]|nr:adenylyl-sulfate kinase [Vicinamibacterales bacterium]